MGFEKILRIITPLPSLNAIIYNYFETLLKVEILSTIQDDTRNEILLRYLDRPDRDKWPEDIRICWSEYEIYICFHAGNVRLQNRIYEGLKLLLNENAIVFEEMDD